MNEDLIRSLANQASDHAEAMVPYFEGLDDGLPWPAKLMKVRDLKLTELIVQECCEVAHCNSHVGGLTLGGIMKDHFGVEL